MDRRACSRSVQLTPASAIKIRPVRWLWLHRLALGTLALIGGREGIGKSICAYTLAAQITRGRLPGVFERTARSVIVADLSAQQRSILLHLVQGAPEERSVVRMAPAERTLPHNLEAERSVLGAILLHNDAFNVAANIIGSADFFRDAHRRIFAKMGTLSERHDAIDLVTLREALGRSGDLDEVGGPAYISALVDGLPRSTNVEEYARIIKTKAGLRHIIFESNKTLARAYEADIDPAALASTTQEQLETIAASAVADSLPAFETLRDRLARPVDPVEWRFRGLQPAGSRALLAAQFKAGKTNLVSNIVRSLADGEPLFGVFEVTPVAGTIVVLDVEMADRQLRAWYRTQGIRRDDRVIVVPMRGLVSAFNILDRGVRRRWADRLRAYGAEYLVVDCLRPLMDAFGFDENKDAGRLLVAIDALMAEAGIPDALIVHHMGHTGERSRGDSRLRDWPDVEWQLVRKTDDAASPRFFRAYGRDVDVAEGQLAFDPETRRLALVGGSRQDAQLTKVLDAIVETLTAKGEPMSGRAIKSQLADSHPRNVIDEALKRGRETGAVVFETGARNANLYRVNPVSRVSQMRPRDSVFECPAAYIKRDTRTLPTAHSSVPKESNAETF